VKSLALAAVFVFGTALAQGWTLEGKARLYVAGEATVHARLLGENEAEIQVGSIDARGGFTIALPETPPSTPVAPNGDCSFEVTPGLKVVIVERLEVRRDSDILGELSLSSRPVSSGSVGLGDRESIGQYGFLFHANRSGSIRQRCVMERETQFADVNFQPGWNWVTARVATKDDKPALYLSSGVTNGLMRWWFIAAKPE
jgi:hypothetical protein